jgi:hypothetical protein
MTRTERALGDATATIMDEFDGSSTFRVDGHTQTFRGVCRVETLSFMNEAGGKTVEGNLVILTPKVPLDYAGVDLRAGKGIHWGGRRWAITDLSNADDVTDYHIECQPANQGRR